jgi:hypothetical protein
VDAMPVVSNDPSTVPGLLWKCFRELIGSLLGQSWGRGERLTASQLQERFVRDPFSLNPGLRCAAKYLLQAQGDVRSALRQCGESRRSPDRAETVNRLTAYAYLEHLCSA